MFVKPGGFRFQNSTSVIFYQYMDSIRSLNFSYMYLRFNFIVGVTSSSSGVSWMPNKRNFFTVSTLASFLLTLNLLAFLFHTVFEFLDAQYQCIRKELGPRQTFFNDLRALLRYMLFDNWQHLLIYMMEGLELELDTS